MKLIDKIVYLFIIILANSGLAQSQSEIVITPWDVGNDATIDISLGGSIQFIGLDSAETFRFEGLLEQPDSMFSNNHILIIDDEILKIFENTPTKKIIRTSVEKQLTLNITSNPLPSEDNSAEDDSTDPDPTENNTEPETTNTKTALVYDALKIKANLNDPCELEDILSNNYGISSDAELKKNSLLSSIISSINCEDVSANNQGAPGSSANGNSSSALSSLGGLDVTKYADGLAKFLVKRAKEELTIAFFEDFEKAINNNKDLTTLFPATASSLSLIGKEIYNYQRYIGLLREQFETDLNQLPEHFRELIQSNHDEYFKSHPGLKTVLVSLSDLVIGVRDKTHPGEIIQSFNADDYKAYDQNLGATFETIQLISEALREDDAVNENQYWVDKSVFKQVMKDETTFRIFMGLIAQRAKDIDFKDDKNLTKEIFKINNIYLELKPIFNEIITNTETINALIKSDLANNNFSPEDLERYFNSVDGTLKGVVSLLEKLGLENKLNKAEEVLSAIETFNDLYSDVVNKKYSAAVLNLAILYKKTLADTDGGDKQIELIKKYGMFIASMLQAENSDDVAAVIEAYALPSGSSRIKRVSKRNVSLNAYLGPYGGVEFAPDDTTRTGVLGLTAPVGVAYSWGRIGSNKNMSFSIFVSVIDIGAIAEFRFDDDENEVAQIYLREIFSPGAFISYGLPNSPISLNFGIQQAALLREAGTTANETRLQRNTRLSASVVVDIPLMNFRTKSK